MELANDLPLAPARVILVDHHGEYAGEDRPTSLHQVFDWLALPPERWIRWFELVAANDWGYIPALVALGASQEEIVKVRAADRAAQGITAAEEIAGEIAAASAKTMVHGKLTIVQLPHARTATVTDRLAPELGGPGYENLVVYSPDQVNFFGAGELVHALDKAFPDGWYGGALPDRGFWGHGEPVPEVLPVLLEHLRQAAAAEIASLQSQGPALFDQLTALPTLVRAFDRVEENHGAPGVDRGNYRRIRGLVGAKPAGAATGADVQDSTDLGLYSDAISTKKMGRNGHSPSLPCETVLCRQPLRWFSPWYWTRNSRKSAMPIGQDDL